MQRIEGYPEVQIHTWQAWTAIRLNSVRVRENLVHKRAIKRSLKKAKSLFYLKFLNQAPLNGRLWLKVNWNSLSTIYDIN